MEGAMCPGHAKPMAGRKSPEFNCDRVHSPKHADRGTARRGRERTRDRLPVNESAGERHHVTRQSIVEKQRKRLPLLIVKRRRSCSCLNSTSRVGELKGPRSGRPESLAQRGCRAGGAGTSN
jgi:hypothetical protein